MPEYWHFKQRFDFRHRGRGKVGVVEDLTCPSWTEPKYGVT